MITVRIATRPTARRVVTPPSSGVSAFIATLPSELRHINRRHVKRRGLADCLELCTT